MLVFVNSSRSLDLSQPLSHWFPTHFKFLFKHSSSSRGHKVQQ